jgi:hypothetical protein
MSRQALKFSYSIFAQGSAIQRVGKICAELFHIERVDAQPDLFIGGESYADGAVLDLGCATGIPMALS